MDLHPSEIPVVREFDVSDVAGAEEAAAEMVGAGFEGIRGGYRVTMPKEPRLARRIGYAVTTSVSYGLRRAGADRRIRYWTYHHDEGRYAIVLVGASALESMG